ncbi:superinfection immunity protein [Granulicella aggregans]|uniref:superinfection immunity protein n=1 Tax=Granulicella aggregans TaxID=474949 RepID=UPI0021E08741|nr:superinfection immunity protein [Granulicella aggregans]
MVTLTVLTLIYFLPTLVATHRGHTAGGILILNLFFGWTGIGWLAMMLWALLSPPPYYVLMPPVYLPYGGWRRY